jgi:polar amino acid transport system ATP-binding protein
MGFAGQVSDHCLFIANGRVLEEGRTTDLFNSPRNPMLVNFLARVLRY